MVASAFTVECLVRECLIFVCTFDVIIQQELAKLAEEAFAMGAEFGNDLFRAYHLDMAPDLDKIDLFDLPKSTSNSDCVAT